MGLFSNAPVRYSDWKPSSQHEAWVGVVFACVMADGVWSDTELDTITRQFMRNEVFIGKAPSDLVGTMRHVGGEIGWGEVAKRCAAVLASEYCPTAFAMACEMAMIDGDLNDRERTILEDLVFNLRLEPEAAKKIVEVYEIRMKYQRRT